MARCASAASIRRAGSAKGRTPAGISQTDLFSSASGDWMATVPRSDLSDTVSRFVLRFSRALERFTGTSPHRVATVWSEMAGEWEVGGASHWTELELVQERINRRISGNPSVDPYVYLIRNYLQGKLPLERALTIGCGDGSLERGLSKYGFCRRHDAFDIAPGAIEKAKVAAAEAGLDHIRYEVKDANTAALSPRTYDCVFGQHSIHHVAALEHVFRGVAKALKPGGLFVLNEFVGPTRFQWTDRQLAVANGLCQVLPPAVLRRVTDGRPRGPITRLTIAEMIEADPSESVRSSDILPLLPRYFDVLEVRGYGGTILHLLLDEIAGNFRAPSAARLLDIICDLEELLIAGGDLTHDFAFVVARRRSERCEGER